MQRIGWESDEALADPVWVGDAGRPLSGWLSIPVGGPRNSGVAIVPPLGYEQTSVHHTLRVLAQRLAAAGHTVLRVDLDGTGDAAGDQWDGDRLAAWRGSVRVAVAALRDHGLSRIGLIGVRLGATLALLEGQSLGVESVVAWLPVSAGRRYVRELRLLATPIPEGHDCAPGGGTLVFAGSVFSAETLEQLAGLRLDDVAPAARTLLIEDPGRPAPPLVAQLRDRGGIADHVTLSGSDEALRTAPEFAVVPGAILDTICDWLGEDATGSRHPLTGGHLCEPATAILAWRGGHVRETMLRLPGGGHAAVVTAPVQRAARPTTLVLLNPGSETHVGPGRAWVEYARELALRGHRTVRVDFLGWGESPDAGRAPGRPYDECCEQDIGAIVDGLARLGVARVAIAGLCSSAWIALRSALTVPSAAVIAFNPQLYWARGDEVEIDWDRIRARRADEIRRIDRGARWGLWSLLDVVGPATQVTRWLDGLSRRAMPVHLVFAEDDDGLIFLRRRYGRHIQRAERRGTITVRELPGVDHPMHRVWMRDRVVSALAEALREIDAFSVGEASPRSA